MPSKRAESYQTDSGDLSPAVVVGLAVSLFGVVVLGQIELPRWIAASATRSFLTNSLSSWVLAGAIVTLVVYWERRDVASIGLELPGRRDVAVGIGAGLLATVIGLLVTGGAVAVFDLQAPPTLSAIAELSLPVQVGIVGTAVVTEEILWRGYPIERLTELTGNVWIGGVVSGLVFLAVHLPAWGLVGAIPQSVFTTFLVGVYVWRRNVVVTMLTHGVINGLVLLVLPAML
ncbi:CPBP family intramembrane glutamic endopeptidase [Salinirubrum litoreum]|uniref:CPBP family intramembrane glutamic endopeptidase n=1 Tax=Salinirubrum litoreum TaxID=1126234 RepID=A0ABD5RGV3_9EURY|nr:type II CAAX endopeptidase family protein [Salinirubrum litoreum]